MANWAGRIRKCSWGVWAEFEGGGKAFFQDEYRSEGRAHIKVHKVGCVQEAGTEPGSEQRATGEPWGRPDVHTGVCCSQDRSSRRSSGEHYA